MPAPWAPLNDGQQRGEQVAAGGRIPVCGIHWRVRRRRPGVSASDLKRNWRADHTEPSWNWRARWRQILVTATGQLVRPLTVSLACDTQTSAAAQDGRERASMTDWLSVVSFGACGAAAVQAITFSSKVQAWQAARQHERSAGKSPLPKLATFLDPPAFALVLITRLGLGAMAAAAFHAQVNGPYAAMAVGASAPALLRQLGTIRGVAEVDASPGIAWVADGSAPAAEPGIGPGEEE
jgi:hypothetical protein